VCAQLRARMDARVGLHARCPGKPAARARRPNMPARRPPPGPRHPGSARTLARQHAGDARVGSMN